MHDTAALSRFVSNALDHLGTHGLTFEIADTPEALRELYAIHRDPEAKWLGPPACIDPDCNDLHAGNALAVMGRDQSGRIVVTRAARLYDLRWGQTLYDHLTTLLWLYPDPAGMRHPGERFEFADGGGIAARAITGKVNFAIAGWHHPDYRGHRFSAIMSPLVRALAMMRWQPDYFCSIVPTLIAGSMFRHYGFAGREKGVVWTHSRNFERSEQDMMFMTAAAAERQILRMALAHV